MDYSLSSLALPVRLTPALAMSDEDFLCFSAANEPLRMEREPNGDILVMTPAGSKTGLINQRISQLLGNWSEQDGRGYAFDSSCGFRLPNGAVRSPDASWLRAERWDALTEVEQDGFAPLSPEFVVELLSAKDRPTVLREKMREWIENGVELAWLIDPRRHVVEVYRSGAEP